jgi:DNA invertase Pin-like site-specific DNA recombinase
MTVRGLRRISVATDPSVSLDAQKHRIATWAEANRPGEGLVIYTDPSVSGRVPLKDRPEGGRLLKDLRSGDVLVVTRIDRLARNTRDLLDTVQRCEEIGATFVAIDQAIDTSGAFGRFLLTLLAALAELEAAIVGERQQAARAELLRQGRHPGGNVPYGFKIVRNPDGKGYVVRPDPKLAPTLAAAVDAIIGGATLSAEARKLGMWPPTLRGILLNPRLYGQTPGGGKLDTEAAIITMTQWRRLQAVLDRPKTWTKTSPTLAPALRCYACGKRLHFDADSDTYRCQSRDSEHQTRPAIMRHRADRFVERIFLEWYGEFPEYAIIGGEDSERAEQLAALDLEIEAVGAALVQRFDPELVGNLERLHREREAVRDSPVSDEYREVATGRTWSQAWAEAEDDSERVELLKLQRCYVILHPAARRVGEQPAPVVKDRVWIDQRGGRHTRIGRFEVVEQQA